MRTGRRGRRRSRSWRAGRRVKDARGTNRLLVQPLILILRLTVCVSSPRISTSPPCCFDSRAKGHPRVALLYVVLGNSVKTNAYIDGFNLYYGCFRHERARPHHKWLDLRALCQALMPYDELHRVHYFTAMVSATPWDMGAPLRQETYIRALRTCPNLYVHLGNFQAVFRTGTPVDPALASFDRVTIKTWEEKGSDVNLATRLLLDAVEGDFQQAIVISNDSDLTEPIRVVRQKFHLPTVVVSPQTFVTRKLQRAASSHAVLDQSLLGECQLRDSIKDKKGRLITRPIAWRE